LGIGMEIINRKKKKEKQIPLDFYETVQTLQMVTAKFNQNS
jgi:hypothetical protein